MLRKLRIVLGLLILGISILFLAWGYWPAYRETRIRPVSASTGLPQQESHQITLVYPPRIRTGDTGVVRLTLDTQGILVPTAESGGTAVSGESVGNSNYYDTHAIVAEARFDIPGMNVRPSDLISASISKGQSAVFYWTLRPDAVGSSRGTIWVYLRIVDKLTGKESRETVSAQIVEMEAVNFFGLPANQVRLVGFVGVVIGLGLSLPFFEAFARAFIEKRANPIK